MRLRSLPGLLLLVVVALFVVPSAVGYYTDWLWFHELGYEQIFLRTLNAQTIVFGVTFAAVFLFVFLNLRFARRPASTRPRVVLGTGADGRPIYLEGQQVAGLALPVLGLFGYVPGSRDPQALSALVTAYCLLPCALKLLAAASLHFLILRNRGHS